jgi:hypothetical protein
MKKLIFIFLFPYLAYCQIDNVIFNNTTVIKMNEAVIEWIERNQHFIESIDGNKIVYIPYEKTYFSNTKGTYIDNQFVQYEWTFKNGKWDITVFTPKTKYYVCDFTKEKDKIIKDKKQYDNDNIDLFKPKDLKNKIKKEKPNKINKVKP